MTIEGRRLDSERLAMLTEYARQNRDPLFCSGDPEWRDLLISPSLAKLNEEALAQSRPRRRKAPA